MNPRPIKVKALDNYFLLITFSNYEKKIFDVKPLLKYPMFKPLENKGLFLLAKTDGMTVYWNDDIDICPDELYLKGQIYNYV
ncbi:MAG TPA: DUF2442 domain-containing protein [Ruminiclostridium sp.]